MTIFYHCILYSIHEDYMLLVRSVHVLLCMVFILVVGRAEP